MIGVAILFVLEPALMQAFMYMRFIILTVCIDLLFLPFIGKWRYLVLLCQILAFLLFSGSP